MPPPTMAPIAAVRPGLVQSHPRTATYSETTAAIAASCERRREKRFAGTMSCPRTTPGGAVTLNQTARDALSNATTAPSTRPNHPSKCSCRDGLID
jgi:hypothetical protein